jgi:transcriptional regulator GlxA family with amidase domain
VLHTSRKPPQADSGRHRIAVVVLGGTFQLDLAVAIQAFGHRPSVFEQIRDEQTAPYDVLLCGRPDTAHAALGYTISDLLPFDEVAAADTVIVPGLEAPTRAHDPEALEAIAAAASAGKRMVSLCAGAFVLGQAGVLDGHRVTTHWALAHFFREAFPSVELDEDALYIDDGQVLSSGGMLAAADLCLHILATDLGQSYANDVSRLLVSPPHRTGGQSQYTKALPTRASGSLTDTMAWVRDHLDQPLDLVTVAAHAHVSTRTLARQFREEAGTTLRQWVSRQRVQRAQVLLEHGDLTISQVAHHSGFGSSETLRRQFHEHIGTTPGAYRETFRARSL